MAGSLRHSEADMSEGMAAFGAAAVGPWVVSPKALASSGEVNVLMWSDYLPPGFPARSMSADPNSFLGSRQTVWMWFPPCQYSTNRVGPWMRK